MSWESLRLGQKTNNPNLEFKFVTANTLIQLEASGIESPLIADKIPELQEIRQDYLQAHGDDKLKLKKRFIDVQYEIKIDQARFNNSTCANIPLPNKH